MEDIAKQDRRLFFREMLRPGRLFLLLIATVIAANIAAQGAPIGVAIALFFAPLVGIGLMAYNASVNKRFIDKKYSLLWDGVRDRYSRFDAVVKRLSRDRVAQFHEMPKTIRRVAESLYAALRRADWIADEIRHTEQGILSRPPSWHSASSDPQAQELYRVADKNIAEYRQHYAGVMAGVQRVEAQCAVYMTTVDTLRMKMLGHRLSGRGPELSSHEFLSAMTEAKIQLQAIDKALDELDFSGMPKMIAAIPIPESQVQR